MSQERAGPPLTVACSWVTGSQCPSVLGQLGIESPCPSPGKECLCRKAAPRVLSAHHPALCLLDVWLDLVLGLLGTEPSSLLLEPGVEHWVCVSVCVYEWKMLVFVWMSWHRGLVLHDCNWKWITGVSEGLWVCNPLTCAPWFTANSAAGRMCTDSEAKFLG